MDHFYDASGHFGLHNCLEVEWAKFVHATFKVGDVAWVKRDAMIGKITPVAIRKVNVRNEGDAYRGVVVNVWYVDSYRDFWEEGQLVNNADAVNYALAYWQAVEEDFARRPNCD